MQDADNITIAKGKKFVKFEAVANEKEAILKQAMGPSGNLRAPTYRIGDAFVIGFNAEMYEGWTQ